MNNFNQIIIVKFEGIWRAVLGCVVNPRCANTHVQYVLNGRVYECRNTGCWRLIGSVSLPCDFDEYAIECNNGDLEYIIERKKLEAKEPAENVRPIDREILEDMVNGGERQENEMNRELV